MFDVAAAVARQEIVGNRQTDLWIRRLTPPLPDPSYRVPRPSVNHSWVYSHIKNVEPTAKSRKIYDHGTCRTKTTCRMLVKDWSFGYPLQLKIDRQADRTDTHPPRWAFMRMPVPVLSIVMSSKVTLCTPPLISDPTVIPWPIHSLCVQCDYSHVLGCYLPHDG